MQHMLKGAAQFLEQNNAIALQKAEAFKVEGAECEKAKK